MTREIALRAPSYSGALLWELAVVAGTTTEGWQDKSAHGAAQAGGCFCSCFWRVSHRAALSRTVCFASIFLIFFSVLHRAGMCHVR